MKNIVIQRGLVCLSEKEFNRVVHEMGVLEFDNTSLKKELDEATKRVKLLEDQLRVTESELKRISDLP